MSQKPNQSPAKRVRFGEEEPRSEREMAFDAKHKKAVASDAKLATAMEAPPRLELGVADLQSAALPLGYGAICSPA